MVLVAGTFVVVSGAVYFAFMAAWLNVFLWSGCRGRPWGSGSWRWRSAAINVKDFLRPGARRSLSIPEAAKPGIYARVRAP